LLNVESNKLLLALSSQVSFVASVVTPLPTNRGKIKGVGKSETKWKSDVPWSK
jgi:hypothetical protein